MRRVSYHQRVEIMLRKRKRQDAEKRAAKRIKTDRPMWIRMAMNGVNYAIVSIVCSLVDMDITLQEENYNIRTEQMVERVLFLVYEPDKHTEAQRLTHLFHYLNVPFDFPMTSQGRRCDYSFILSDFEKDTGIEIDERMYKISTNGNLVNKANAAKNWTPTCISCFLAGVLYSRHCMHHPSKAIPKPPGVKKWKWRPAAIGLKTLLSIPQLAESLDLSLVTESNMNNGAFSRIPVTCRVDGCGHMWTPTINGLVNGGRGCPECYGNVPWTKARLDARIHKMGLDVKIDFFTVTEAHITNGWLSKIPVTCKVCGRAWTPTIHSLVNQAHGCPECAGNVPWTKTRLDEHIRKYGMDVNMDISAVTEAHIINEHSKIPVTCKKPS